MDCNVLRIVQGNDFPTRMTIKAVGIDGSPIPDFSLENSTDIVVKYKSASGEYEIDEYTIEGNNLFINWSGLGLGGYGFEITGVFNNAAWRYAARLIFRIVADQASANIPAGTLVNGVYLLDGWLAFLANTGSGGVESVNGKTGIVILTPEDIGAYAKPSTGIPATDLDSSVQQTLQYVADIEGLIPSQASPSNQLADKNFVNNQVSTNTANFVGTYNSLAELQAVTGATNNDYGFVIEYDSLGNEYYDRYKYNGSQWLFEYKVESTPFTAEQWAAIQSGITSALVTKLSALPTNSELTTQLNGKQDVLVSGTNIKTINNESILGSGNITIEGGGGGAVDSVNGKTGVVVLDAEDIGAATAAQGAKADSAIQEIKTINGNSLVGSGNVNVSATEANVINSLTTGGATDALSAEQGKVLKETIDSLQIDVKDRYSLLEGYTYEMNKWFNDDGTLKDATSGLGIRVFDYVPITAGTYICCCRSYCTYDNNKTKITCDTSGQNTYGKIYTINMPQNGYIRICAAASSDYIRLCLESEKYKTRADYHGIQNLYNPITSPCNVVLLGDSNTYGYGLSDRTKAWSGFYNSAITNLPQNVFCDAKMFTGYFVSQSYSGKLKMGAFGKVYFKVYTDLLSLTFEYIGTVNITIDGVAQTAITSSNPSYELTEGLHEVVLEATSGNNNVLLGFTYHQLRTCVNNAVSGANSSSLASADITSGNLFVVMFGTNDRSLNYGETMNNLSSFITRCKDADKKVILLSPIPPLQETHSSYKINIGQVVSQFANDIKPLVKYIDTYSVMEMYYLIYTRLHNTAIYSDELHLNALGHRLLWSAIAPKLGFAMHISDLIAK